MVSLGMVALFWMGGEFLPPFNEGTFTVSLQAEPGTSLDESLRLAQRAEMLLMEIPKWFQFRVETGPSRADEHARRS